MTRFSASKRSRFRHAPHNGTREFGRQRENRHHHRSAFYNLSFLSVEALLYQHASDVLSRREWEACLHAQETNSRQSSHRKCASRSIFPRRQVQQSTSGMQEAIWYLSPKDTGEANVKNTWNGSEIVGKFEKIVVEWSLLVRGTHATSGGPRRDWAVGKPESIRFPRGSRVESCSCGENYGVRSYDMTNG